MIQKFELIYEDKDCGIESTPAIAIYDLSLGLTIVNKNDPNEIFLCYSRKEVKKNFSQYSYYEVLNGLVEKVKSGVFHAGGLDATGESDATLAEICPF